MQIIQEFNEYHPWSGAREIYNDIMEKINYDTGRLEAALEEIFQDDKVSATSINDLLWFDSEIVYEMLGIPAYGSETDEEDD